MRKLSKDLQVQLKGSVKAIIPQQLVDAKPPCGLGVQLLVLKHYWRSLSFSSAAPAQGFGAVGKVPHGFPLEANPGNVLLS